MYLTYSRCNGNPLQTARESARQSARRPPDVNVIRRMDDRLRNTGSVWPTVNLHDSGRLRSSLTVGQADAILYRVEETPEERWSLNVWAGILGDRLLEPYMLPERLSGQSYLVFLNEVLTEFLDDIPLAAIQGLWFQHDGDPAHFCAPVCDLLDIAYPGRWIGSQGNVL
ncbi:DUF4817 domain-containing protein [Trichonephila clavipes]|nr:DUF4817 domain-containing protein [Trichonephila clavipes]